MTSAQSSALTIYGDSLSGNCQKIKFVADHLGIAYDWVETSVLNKETRTPQFLALNPAGQVPLAVFPGHGPLAQSGAIILHLAEGSALIPKDPFQRALMLQWMFWEQYTHEPAVAVLRFQKFYLKKSDDQIDPSLVRRSARVLTQMNDHLAGAHYFVGEAVSLADVALVAYTRVAHEGGMSLEQYPHVRDWVRRVETALNIEHAV